MKLQTEDRPVIRSGEQTEKEFTIRATSKAFQILSSGLYSNKIAAPIRELACNAYDAHVMAGCADRPFEVHLPTMLDPTFSVKDFGTGLSHEQVLGLYTTYFESTKQFDNDVIGALGLGSKSPFAYTDNFSVISRYNGEARLYTSFINEAGHPSISMMGDAMPTDEPNGMTISFAVRDADFSRFADQARSTLMYFTPAPTITGNTVEPFELTYSVRGTNWGIRDGSYHARNSGPAVVQGAVSYPILAEQVRESGLLTDIASSLLNTPVDLFVQIGDVDIAPSREALQYNKRTVQNLANVLNEAAVEMRSRIQAEIDACADLWQAQLKHADLMDRARPAVRAIYQEICNKQGALEYNGVKVTGHFDINVAGIKNTQIKAMKTVWRRKGGYKLDTTGTWSPGSMIAEFEIQANPHLFIVVADLAKNAATVLEQYTTHARNEVSRASNGNVEHIRLLLIAPTNARAFDAAEVDAIVAQFGNVPVQRLSALPYANAASNKSATYKPRPKGQVLKFIGFREKETGRYSRTSIHRVFSRHTWEKVDIDMQDGGYYVRLDRFNAMRDNYVFDELDLAVDNASRLGIIPAFTDVYGLNDRDLKLIAGNPAWIDLAALLKQKSKKLSADIAAIAGNKEFVATTSSYLGAFAKKWGAMYKGCNTQFSQFMTSLDAVLHSHQTDIEAVKYLAAIFGTHAHTAVENTRMARAREFEALMDRYPMIKFIALADDARIVKAVREYVDLVDAAEQFEVATLKVA